MQTPKGRNGSPVVPQKISPRAVRQLKTSGESDSPSSSNNQAGRTQKDNSPKVADRRSPRSPVSEKKRPNRVSELESKLTQLQDDLKKVKNQLNSSESCKKQAQQEAEESKNELSLVSARLEETKKQLSDVSASEEARVTELHKISQEKDLAWQSELETIRSQYQVESAALASAFNEIERLKAQIEAAQINNEESTNDDEINSLKFNLSEALSLVECMKMQMKDCKESELKAQGLVDETLSQLEMAKKTVETLKSDGVRAMEAYNTIAMELDQSRALVRKLEEDLINARSTISQNPDNNHEPELEPGKTQIEEELSFLTSEVNRLRSALECAEIRCNQEQIQSTVKIKSAYEMVEKLKAESSRREVELESGLMKAKADIEDLKANLMDKETELQGITEENEGLNMKIERSLSCQREYELETELRKAREALSDLKANLMDKETEMQNISEENEALRMEIKKREIEKGKMNNKALEEAEAAKASEREATTKLKYLTEEVDRSNMRAARVSEQLAAVEASSSEMEAELRRIKVQSDQWRKAAEAAAAMLSAEGNGKFIERTGSLDINYSPVKGKLDSPYSEDADDDLVKKKNGNVLKKIGILWKKPQK